MLPGHRKLSVHHQSELSGVLSIDDRVEEWAERWEPEPVWKTHYLVTLEDGRRLVIVRNMKTGGWYRALG